MGNLYPAYADIVDHSTVQADQAIRRSLKAVDAAVPEGCAVVPANEQDPWIAPILTFKEQAAFAKQIQRTAPDCFRAPRVGDAIQQLMQRPEALKAFGKIGLQPDDADIDANRALWLPHAGSVYTQLAANPREVVTGQLGETPGNFRLGYRTAAGAFVDRDTHIAELLDEAVAFKDEEGRVWVEQGNSAEAEIDSEAAVNQPPVTRTREAALIAGFFRRLSGVEPAGPLPVNEYICAVYKARPMAPAAITTVGWSIGHRAVAIADRAI